MMVEQCYQGCWKSEGLTAEELDNDDGHHPVMVTPNVCCKKGSCMFHLNRRFYFFSNYYEVNLIALAV